MGTTPGGGGAAGVEASSAILIPAVAPPNESAIINQSIIQSIRTGGRPVFRGGGGAMNVANIIAKKEREEEGEKRSATQPFRI